MAKLIDFAEIQQISCWQGGNDLVMGGLSSSLMLPTEQGTGVFSGNLSLENQGGFASVRCNHLAFSLEPYAGLAIRCLGDGKRYKLNLRSDTSLAAINWQVGFETRLEWQEQQFLWAEFRPTRHGREVSDPPRFDPAAMIGIGLLIADRQEGPFRLELEWIKALD